MKPCTEQEFNDFMEGLARDGHTLSVSILFTSPYNKYSYYVQSDDMLVAVTDHRTFWEIL